MFFLSDLDCREPGSLCQGSAYCSIIKVLGVSAQDLIICCVLCLISNECSLGFMDVLDPFMIFECFLLICFCLYRPAECLDAVLQREGQGNHLAGQASSFVLGYLASMLRELDPLSWVRDLGVLSEKFSLMRVSEGQMDSMD